MHAQGHRRVAIIGAGFSGIAVAANLLRRSAHPLTVILIERSPGREGGIAYATQNPHHLLNVPAGNMSAFVDEPDHFVQWLNESGIEAAGGDFIARGTYKRYLQALLEETPSRPDVRLERVYGDASSVQRAVGSESYAIAFSNGSVVEADSVVLALGNAPPQPREGWLNDPWDPHALERIPRDEPVLIVGTGLTAIDVAIALQRRGRSAPMFAISRHGLLPHAHRGAGPAAGVKLGALPLGSVRELVRTVRVELQQARRHGQDWRDVVGALRPHTQRLWASFSDLERERFMRHVRHHWEVARHRIAPRIAQEIRALRESGDLRVFAGRISVHRIHDDGIDIDIVQRGEAGRHTLRVARAINCTGPNRDVRLTDNPLVTNLLQGGIAAAGPLNMGIDTDAVGRVVDGHGGISTSLFAVGPLRVGNLWETTAVPEIRAQAADIAASLMRRGTRDAA